MLLFVVDPSGRVTFLEAQRPVLGIDPVEAVGKSADELFAHAPEIIQRLHEAMAGTPFAGVVKVGETGGYAGLTCHPLHDPDGKVTGVSAVMLDATEWKREEEIGRREEARSILIATMSHEARTPLNAILGFTELLGSGHQGELNEGQRRYLANIDSAGRQLLAMVTDVIDLTRLEQGTMTLSPANLNAASVIDEAVAQVGPLATAREVRLRATCPPDLTLYADRARLLQVIWSLTTNAIRFTPHGGTVSIMARADGRSTRIDITDSGPGIPAHRLSRIYLDFTQIGSAGEGPGLGLALTRQLVALLQGRVTVTSKLGAGTTFTLHLPRSK
jgi:signal transduction histidine kinase